MTSPLVIHRINYIKLCVIKQTIKPTCMSYRAVHSTQRSKTCATDLHTDYDTLHITSYQVIMVNYCNIL